MPSWAFPTSPEGPAVACRVRISATRGQRAGGQLRRHGAAVGALRQVHPAGGQGTDKDKSEAAKLGDALAEGVLGRLVRAQLRRGPQVKGR